MHRRGSCTSGFVLLQVEVECLLARQLRVALQPEVLQRSQLPQLGRNRAGQLFALQVEARQCPQLAHSATGVRQVSLLSDR